MIDRSNLAPVINIPRNKKRRRPMRKRAKKTNRILDQYMKLRAEFLKAHPWCQHWMAENGVMEHEVSLMGYVQIGENWVAVPRSAEIHHKKGRGQFMLDTSTWMAVRPGHDVYIHQDTKRYEKGYCLPRR